MSSTEKSLQRLQERGSLLLRLLRSNKRSHQKNILAWGGLQIAWGVVVGLLLWMLMSSLVPAMSRGLNLVVATLFYLGMAALVWRFWVRPLRAIPNLAVFSKLVEERRDFKDMLRAALEFSQKGTPLGGSVDLAAATVDRAYGEAQSLQLTQLFEFPHRGRNSSLVTAGLAVLLLMVMFLPSAALRGWQGLAYAYPTPEAIVYGQMQVLGGDKQVLAGEDVMVRVRDHGPVAPEMVLRFNDTGDLWKTRVLEPDRTGKAQDYSYRFDRIRDNTLFRFESVGRTTQEYTIEVVQRPIVNRFSLRLIPPSYTGREPVTLEEGRGDAIALLGTEIEISGQSSVDLARAFLVPDGDEGGAITLPKRQSMEVVQKDFKSSFLLRSDIAYHFDILDVNGHRNTDPVTYQISALEDRPPYVELRTPQGDSEIPKSLKVPLMVYASDDFGISRMILVYKHERADEDLGKAEARKKLQLSGPTATTPAGEPLGKKAAPEVVKIHEWDLEGVGLFPGDFVTFYIEVEDNDAFSGRKKARTPTYRLRLPTLGELYTEIQERDDERVSELEDVLEKGQEVQEKFEEIARELKKHPEMDWEKQKKIDRAVKKQRDLSKKVQELAQDLQNELNKMEEQQLVSEEIAQKMEQIRELMEQVEDEKLREYMKRMEEAMKEISPEEIQRAMEEMEFSQEEFLKRLERTKSLLEQLKREQRLDAMVEQAQELLERQEELADRTQDLAQKMDENGENQEGENSEGDNQEGENEEANQSESDQNQEQSDKLAEEQSDLSEDAERLQEELNKLAQEFNENGQEQLNELNEQMQEQGPSEDMRQASEQLQQQQPQEAQQSQQSAEQRLRSLYEELMQAQQMMAMQMQAQAGAALAKAARLSLDVSFRQENLAREKAPMGDYESSGDLARTQRGLHNATRKIVEGLDEMAKQSLLIPPQAMQLLGGAMGKMDQGVRSYEKGNPHAGRIRGEDAYGDLNKAVIELSRGAKSCSSGSSGQPKPSSRQRMQDMLQRQRDLNNSSRRLADRLQNPHNMSPEERAQMSQLLGEQQAIEKELQDIERQAAEKKDLLGRLDKMQEEMKEVIDDMASEQLSEETLRVQERIISRMLQAQRSLHKRDYNKERMSRPGEEIFSQGGAALDEQERADKLKRDIQRALESGTPAEYQELVRQYFRAIAEGEGTLKEQEAP